MAAPAPITKETSDDCFLREQLAVTAADPNQQAFLRGWHQLVCALKRFEEVYALSDTQTARRAIAATHHVLFSVLSLADYSHRESNLANLPWHRYVGLWLKARARTRKPEDRLDDETVRTFCAVILSSQKVNRKVFQPLADAEAQARDVSAGWKAVVAAVAAAEAS